MVLVVVILPVSGAVSGAHIAVSSASAVVEVRAMLAAAAVFLAMRIESAVLRGLRAVLAEQVVVMLCAAVSRLELPAVALLGVVGLSEGVNGAALCTADVFLTLRVVDVIMSLGKEAAPVTAGAPQRKRAMSRSKARARR